MYTQTHIHTHTYPLPLEPPSHVPPHPLRSSQSTGLSSLLHTANSHWLSTYLVYEFQCSSLKSSYPLLFPLCPQVCSLCLCLLCCPANRFISTIFLDSLSHVHARSLSLSLYIYIYIYKYDQTCPCLRR